MAVESRQALARTATMPAVAVNDSSSSFGELLRAHRRAVELTQEELAERAGISPQSISEWERGGKHVPRRDTLALLVRALGLMGADQLRFEAVADRRRRSRTAIRWAPAPIG